MDRETKPKQYPVYDPQKDGNVFEWIRKAVAEVRARQTIERLSRPSRKIVVPEEYDPRSK